MHTNSYTGPRLSGNKIIFIDTIKNYVDSFLKWYISEKRFDVKRNKSISIIENIVWNVINLG